jgi:alkyldihydroxyacetonephosphate synthase
VARRLKHWGWGYEDEQPSAEELSSAASFLSQRLGFGSADPEPPVSLSEVSLPPSRLRPPDSLADVCRLDPYERALHAYGRSYSDIVRAFRGRFDHPPDVVAHPRHEREVQEVLSWAGEAHAALIPFGGGTTVVGGVEADVGDGYSGVVTMDLKALNRVL